MGSFNLSCGISGSPLPPYSDVMIIVLAKTSQGNYRPISLPIEAEYYDYGYYRSLPSWAEELFKRILSKMHPNVDGTPFDVLQSDILSITKRARDGLSFKETFFDSMGTIHAFPVMKSVYDELMKSSISKPYTDTFSTLQSFIDSNNEEHDAYSKLDSYSEELANAVRKAGTTSESDEVLVSYEKLKSRPKPVLNKAQAPMYNEFYQTTTFVAELDRQHMEFSTPRDELINKYSEMQFLNLIMSTMNIPYHEVLNSGQNYDIEQHGKLLSTVARGVFLHFKNNREASDYDSELQITTPSIREVVKLSSVIAEVQSNQGDVSLVHDLVISLREINPTKRIVALDCHELMEEIGELFNYMTLLSHKKGDVFLDLDN